MNTKKINERAQKVFENHPSAKQCFVTNDDQVFINKNAADLHASTNATGKKLTYSTIQRPGTLEPLPGTVKPIPDNSKSKKVHGVAIKKPKPKDKSKAPVKLIAENPTTEIADTMPIKEAMTESGGDLVDAKRQENDPKTEETKK